MPVFDHLKIYRDQIAPLLEPGEQPLAMSPFSLAQGSNRLERSPEDMRRGRRSGPGEDQQPGTDGGAAPRPSVAERVAGEALEFLTGGGGPLGRDVDWDKLLGGVSATGHVGSYAYRLVHATDAAKGPLRCLVTDRRVAVLASQNDGRSIRLSLVTAIPRQAVMDARVEARGYSRGRVLVAFTDSSAIALHTGIVDKGRARQVVHALTHGAPPP